MERRNIMQNAFEIKGIRMGDGQPVICVPVVALKKEEVITNIRFLAEQKVQMIEWRVDCFEEVDDFHAVSEVLQVIRPVLEHTIFLFTFRTKQQGGSRKMEEWKILKLNELAAKSGCADLIDLEFFEATKPEKEIRRFQRMGVRVIASHHDFDETPDDRILRMLMEQMQQGGADVAKLAVMPKNADDVVRLLKLTNDIKQKYPTLPVVTMSMGALGVVSRMAGEIFGSCITFGAVGEISAPGQIPAGQLEHILQIIHKGLE